MGAFALALALATVLPILLAGSATAEPANAPTLEGAYIIGGGQALVIVGYIGFANVWQPSPNGSQVYSSAAFLTFFNLRNVTVDIPWAVAQDNGFNASGVKVLQPISSDTLAVPVSDSRAWVHTVLSFYGRATWQGQYATPVSLIPSYLLNLGAIDLFALTVISLVIIAYAAGINVGRWAMRRAIHAPEFRLLVWGHVCLAAIATAVLLDYQQVDSVFAGWSPFIYPLPVFPMAFANSLAFFNRGQRVLLTQGIVTGQGELGWRLTGLTVGRDDAGRLVPLKTTWGGFWARFWHAHATPFDDGDESHPRPLLMPVEDGESPTDGRKDRRRARKDRLRRPHSAAEALTRFPVVNPEPRRGYSFVAFVKGDSPPEVRYPVLRWTRARTIPAVVREVPNAVGGVTPTVIRPERTVRRPSLPHYELPTGTANVELEDRHYAPAAAVWAGFATIRDLGRAISKLGGQLEVLRAGLDNRVQDEVYSRLRTHYALVGRSTSGISDEEARAAARDLSPRWDPEERKP